MTSIPDRSADGAKALGPSEAEAMGEELHGDWSMDGTRSVSRRIAVRDFRAALALLNAIGDAAEEENHHPDLAITDYRFVTVTLSTHDVGGLTANDFVMARRTDALV